MPVIFAFLQEQKLVFFFNIGAAIIAPAASRYVSVIEIGPIVSAVQLSIAVQNCFYLNKNEIKEVRLSNYRLDCNDATLK